MAKTRLMILTKARPALCVLILVSIYFVSAGCENKEKHAPVPPDVLVAEVIQKDVPVITEWIGTTDGYINAQIRARVQGYLQSRNYREGSLVRAGDLMFVIDPRPYQAALNQSRAQLSQAEAALGKTRLDVARYTPLAAEGAISQEELDNAVQANRENEALVDAARAALEQAELNLGWTRIQSPINGIAGIALAQIGDLINENFIMTTVSQVDPIKVVFPISEGEYLVIAQKRSKGGGDPTEQKELLTLVLGAGTVYPSRGRILHADRQVDVKTGTITIEGMFPNPGNILRPGQYAKVRAVTDTKKGAPVVHQRAVQELQGSYQVAVVGPDNKIEIRAVTPGQRVENLWVIDSGLKPGERVVVEGLQKVKNGITVNPKPAPVESENTPGSQGVPTTASPDPGK